MWGGTGDVGGRGDAERGNGVEVETISALVTDSSTGRGEGGEGEMLPAVDVDKPVGGEEGTASVQPPVVVRGHSTEDVQLDVREIDVKEEDRLKQFLINGCECSIKCTSKFTQQHFQLMRSNAMELNRTELRPVYTANRFVPVSVEPVSNRFHASTLA